VELLSVKRVSLVSPIIRDLAAGFHYVMAMLWQFFPSQCYCQCGKQCYGQCGSNLWHRGGNVMAIFLFTVDCHFTWKIAMLWQFFSSLWIVTSLENRNIMVYFKPFELNTTKLLLT